MEELDLNELRKEIDACDAKIVELLNERFKIVLKVGEYKKSKGEPIRVPAREQAVLDKVCTLNQGPIKDETLCAVYRLIMDGAVALEEEV